MRSGRVLALAVLVLVAGCDAPGSVAVPTSAPPSSRATSGGDLVAALDALAVKGRAPMKGYTRERFGQAWLDADRNGCDTRNDVLARDLTDVRFKPGTRDCLVLSGTLHDPYTSSTIDFVYGDGDLVDVDHVVALGDAWATGADGWDVRERAALANDPMNLLAVDASANRQKGDGDAATWLPSARSYRCDYVARQVAVKAKYRLWVTAPERRAIARVLRTCPGEVLPPASGAPTSVDQNLTDPGAPSSGGYASCDAARAAGAAPLHRGDPGYSPQLDGDHDGVACE